MLRLETPLPTGATSALNLAQTTIIRSTREELQSISMTMSRRFFLAPLSLSLWKEEGGAFPCNPIEPLRFFDRKCSNCQNNKIGYDYHSKQHFGFEKILNYVKANPTKAKHCSICDINISSQYYINHICDINTVCNRWRWWKHMRGKQWISLYMCQLYSCQIKNFAFN